MSKEFAQILIKRCIEDCYDLYKKDKADSEILSITHDLNKALDELGN